MKRTVTRQEGAALIVSLIMLILITLIAVASSRLGRSNLLIVGNMQQRTNALAGAQGTIEQVVSSMNFTQTPSNAIANPCVTNNTVCIDVNGDGKTDINVSVNPQCLTHYVIPDLQLDYTSANDQGCLLGVAQNSGVVGASTGSSICASSLWDTQATATDVSTNAQLVVNEGTAVRMDATTSSGYCP